MDTGTLNYCWSQALVAGLHSAGVRQVVISPGSRSTPLTLALLRQPGMTSTVIVDERCAAFFALGIAKVSRTPVVVVATSGSALANWLPAVIEADQAGVPLILISADRPPELQSVGANQTIDQSRLFASQARATHLLAPPHTDFNPASLNHLASQVVESACWPHPGPVHINQPFREPLLPTESPAIPQLPPIAVSRSALQPDARACQALLNDLRGRRGLIVCGELPGDDAEIAAIRRLADHLGCAILAEPLSNLRYGPPQDAAICANYLSWLPGEPAAEPFRIDWVLRFGSFPVTRKLQNFLAGVRQQFWVDPWPRMSDPQHRLTHLFRATPAQFVAAAIGDSMPHPNLDLRDLCLQLDRQTPAASFWPVTTLIDAAPAGSALFIGNSLVIRQLDTASGRGEKPLRFFGNRGASGIDGNLSTALGIARVHGSVIALVGDLTCQHDIGALASSHGLNTIIVVLNNGGGGIFDTLPQAVLPEFETGWRTPQTLDFALVAQAFGLSYQRSDSAESLAAALKLAIFSVGPQMIEVRGF
ncbi:2-succinyl-5-enolpyruvyl-6-hydroxy-3-cyclohexene-1-carboxylic-acid synthase [Dechloromonas sp.]|uniref:2-succinyl-5-enolpyruvyl-6-hydroxy-3- cyclohexene-1-carboxylic-acid synthase n=1 Tax=Dechloromonas sp. TaxID=1917218 RepID=UPI001215C3B5|nr:2-succinyl-5-enolpyruvyl-6-hydroxy-3-cyclohexene-1-carboxylic-acid synthase [Dechloromonas sp.]MBU3696338.1 2-succinyl-5-enolpyruvyl-6-hydroxy-3-cyclohexene-1-carboxylic-acid synthase [Dechloromonas sp.]TEX49155.1 MAG: 2-succinyl-5-enolpyruvyl-6-hydroxy-3-cyclohexene-1-carboxylic-acid synthase [Rhodocyclaceae bacterium]